MDTLSFNRTDRNIGEFQTARSFLDFQISGVSLYSELVSRNFDYISCLGWVGDRYEKEARSRLLGNSPGDMPKGRVAVYVCPECVDPFCGAITTLIQETDTQTIWNELAYDNGMDMDQEIYIHRTLGLGPYRFNKTDYEKIMVIIP